MDFRELINKIDSINSEAKKEPERLTFDDAIKHVKDITFTPPTASGAKFSIANNSKFKGQDVNDPKVKLSLLQDALKNFPAMLFGEIAQRIKPTTDAQIELSQFVGDISNQMDPEGSHIGMLSKQQRDFAIEVVKAALRGMELERDPDQSTYNDDDAEDANEMESSLPWKKYESSEKQDDKVEEGDNIYHSCVKSFKHEKFGEGEVLHGEHTLSESGEVSHYDAKFVREDGSQFIVRNIPVANMKECVVVEHGHPKKKKKVKEEETVDEAHYQDWKRKTIPVNKDVELAGDSIWDKEGTNPKSVHVKEIQVQYEIDTESDDAEDRDTTYVSVQVEHDGPWTIYTDTGFERAISQMIGIDVDFTEQGMQDDGEASLEGSVATKDIPADAKPLESVEQEDWFQGQTAVTLEGDSFYETFGWIGENDENIEEAEYQGRTVKLNKPMRGDVKKFKVYVKNPKGNIVKVNFGDPDMRIKKSNPARRKSFRARHNCDSPGPKHKARYWSCRKW
jgi:hypothetical protein